MLLVSRDKMQIVRCLVVLWAAISLCSCSSNVRTDPSPLSMLPAASVGEHFNVIVEASAGSHYRNAIVIEEGRFRKVRDSITATHFLPYPTNAGFIPMLKDSLLTPYPVWILSASVPAGCIVPCQPLALLDYVHKGDAIRSIVMVPSVDSLDVYQIKTFEDLSLQHDGLKYAFEYWLRNKSGVGSISRIRWGDEIEAKRHLVEQLNK
ncbi:MAG: inorganic diphosphatase [Saprospiraceae bacterium]|nr:inorganic diphosphatase [Saprospiraceae bacterium]